MVRSGMTSSTCLVPPSNKMALPSVSTVVGNSFKLLLLFVIVSVTESVPTADFLVSTDGGEREVVLAGRSLQWSPSGSSPTSGSHVSSKRTREVQPIQLCGYRLLEAVRGLCRGNYVGYSRRSDPEMKDGRITMMVRDSSVTSQFPESARYKIILGNEDSTNGDQLTKGTISKRSSHLEPQPHLRYRRNIIDECCKKPCSVNEMIRYCGRN